MITKRVFNECSKCDKKLKEIDIDVTDIKAMAEEEAKERLCSKCAKSSKHVDDVITIELRKRGIF